MTTREARKSHVLSHLQLVKPDDTIVAAIVENFPSPLNQSQKDTLRQRLTSALTYYHFLTQSEGRPSAKQLGEQAEKIAKLCRELIEAVSGSYTVTASPMLGALAKQGEHKLRVLGKGYDDQPVLVWPDDTKDYDETKDWDGSWDRLSDAHLMETLRRVIYIRGLAKRLQLKARKAENRKKSKPQATLAEMCVRIFAEVTNEHPKMDRDYNTGEVRGAVFKFIKSVNRYISDSAIERAVTAFNNKSGS